MNDDDCSDSLRVRGAEPGDGRAGNKSRLFGGGKETVD